jgi:organic radical activating enzyme
LETVVLELAQVAAALRERRPRAVVVTGGEPLLAQAELATLPELLPEFTWDVETNGTVLAKGPFAEAVATFVVSPKLANAGMPEHLRIKAAPLRAYAADPRAWFKFVVANEADVDQVASLVTAYDLPEGRVILMPEGSDVATLGRAGPRVARWALDRGWRFSDRSHVTLYGGARDG